VKVTTQGLAQKAGNWEGQLYRPVEASKPTPVPLTAVPYAVWGNRGMGEMIVWIDSAP